MLKGTHSANKEPVSVLTFMSACWSDSVCWSGFSYCLQLFNILHRMLIQGCFCWTSAEFFSKTFSIEASQSPLDSINRIVKTLAKFKAW